jgi:hypothetical protein
MANTFIYYTGDGSLSAFQVTFDYLSKEFVKVYLDGVLKTIGVHYNFSSERVITFVSPPADGASITFIRVTSGSRLVEFRDASILLAHDLDTSALQAIHIAEEAKNSAINMLQINLNGHYDAVNRRIINLANPIGVKDAVNKQYTDTAINAFSVVMDGKVAQANDSAVNAAQSAVNAAQSAVNAAQSVVDAAAQVTLAQGQVTLAQAQAALADGYADDALVYKNNAQAQVVLASGFADDAEASAIAAAASAAAAEVYTPTKAEVEAVLTGVISTHSHSKAQIEDVLTGVITTHSHTDCDTVDTFHASQTPNPNTIPVADSGGKLADGWLPSINAAQLNGYSAQRTAAADMIPVAGVDGKLDAAWLPTASVGAATESEAGVVELATTTEASTGTDTERAVTPAGLTAGINERAVKRDHGHGAVGSLCFAGINSSTATVYKNPGETVAGSALKAASVGVGNALHGTALSGTWRCLGFMRHASSPDPNANVSTLWQRIS